MEMTAAGQVLNLPVLSAVRLPARVDNGFRRQSGLRNMRENRVYKLPGPDRRTAFARQYRGYEPVQQATGSIIDLYA